MRRRATTLAAQLPSPPLLALGTAILASGAILVALGSHLTLYADEWEMVLWRHGISADTLLDPHNDHIVAAVVVFYKLVLGIFGMSSPVPLHLGAILVYLLAAVLLFVYMRRRVGDWPAFLGTCLILFLGAAAADQLSPFQVFFSGAIAAGLGALLALDRDDPIGDLGACVLLVISVAFGETGISFAIGALVHAALGPPPRRRRLYVGLVPLALYGLWWLGWGHTGPSDLSLHNAATAPRYVLDAAGAALGALLGISSAGDQLPDPVGQQWPPFLLIAVIALAAWRLRRLGRVPPGLCVALAIGVSFWALAGLNENPFRPPDNGRYIYPGAVFVLLIASELLRGLRWNTRAILVAAAATALAVAANLVFLSDSYKLFWKPGSELIRADLSALEIAGPVNPSFLLTPDISPAPFFQISADSYLSAVDAWGSPAYTESELASSPEGAREEADRVLGAIIGLGLRPGGSTHRPCQMVRASPTVWKEVQLGSGTVTLRPRGAGRAHVALGRFSDVLPVDAGTLQPGRSSLTIPADRSSRLWRLGLEGRGRIDVCGGALLDQSR
jgi:hypothetical protein